MARDRLDAVARSHLALHLDGEVVAGAAAGEKPLDHVFAAETKPELVAGQPRLGDDELGAADAEAVADRDLVLERQALDREVLAEGAEGQLLPELFLPVGVVLERVGIDRLRGAAVDGEVGLSVAVEVESTDRTRPSTGSLKIPVVTSRPFQRTVRGRPTFTETTRIRPQVPRIPRLVIRSPCAPLRFPGRWSRSRLSRTFRGLSKLVG